MSKKYVKAICSICNDPFYFEVPPAMVIFDTDKNPEPNTAVLCYRCALNLLRYMKGERKKQVSYII